MDISYLVEIAAQKDLRLLTLNLELCLQYFSHCPFEQKANSDKIVEEEDKKEIGQWL